MPGARLVLIACAACILAGPTAGADELGATVGSLHIEGNTRTDAQVILRAAEVGPGAAYSDELPDLVRQRIYNLRVFDTVSV